MSHWTTSGRSRLKAIQKNGSFSQRARQRARVVAPEALVIDAPGPPKASKGLHPHQVSRGEAQRKYSYGNPISRRGVVVTVGKKRPLEPMTSFSRDVDSASYDETDHHDHLHTRSSRRRIRDPSSIRYPGAQSRRSLQEIIHSRLSQRPMDMQSLGQGNDDLAPVNRLHSSGISVPPHLPRPPPDAHATFTGGQVQTVQSVPDSSPGIPRFEVYSDSSWNDDPYHLTTVQAYRHEPSHLSPYESMSRHIHHPVTELRTGTLSQPRIQRKQCAEMMEHTNPYFHGGSCASPKGQFHHHPNRFDLGVHPENDGNIVFDEIGNSGNEFSYDDIVPLLYQDGSVEQSGSNGMSFVSDRQYINMTRQYRPDTSRGMNLRCASRTAHAKVGTPNASWSQGCPGDEQHHHRGHLPPNDAQEDINPRTTLVRKMSDITAESSFYSSTSTFFQSDEGYKDKKRGNDRLEFGNDESSCKFGGSIGLSHERRQHSTMPDYGVLENTIFEDEGEDEQYDFHDFHGISASQHPSQFYQSQVTGPRVFDNHAEVDVHGSVMNGSNSPPTQRALFASPETQGNGEGLGNLSHCVGRHQDPRDRLSAEKALWDCF